MLPLVAAGIAALAACAVTLHRIRAARGGDEPAPAAAIVVLGAAVDDGAPCPELAARLARALALHRAGWAPLVVCSGGAAEAEAMCRWLLARGVPCSAIVSDGDGTSTQATVSRASGQGRILLVTSPWHVHRTRAEARRRGIDGLVCPAERSPIEFWPRAHRRQLAREVAASWWYAMSARVQA